jgi:hypothetical protein
MSNAISSTIGLKRKKGPIRIRPILFDSYAWRLQYQLISTGLNEKLQSFLQKTGMKYF